MITVSMIIMIMMMVMVMMIMINHSAQLPRLKRLRLWAKDRLRSGVRPASPASSPRSGSSTLHSQMSLFPLGHTYVYLYFPFISYFIQETLYSYFCIMTFDPTMIRCRTEKFSNQRLRLSLYDIES